MRFGFSIFDFGLKPARCKLTPRAVVACHIRNPKSKIQNRRRGAALIDVIIGGVLLGVGLAAVISLASRSLRTQIDGEKQLVASWIADELLTMVLVEGPVNYRKQYDTSGQCGYPFEEFNYDLVIEDLGLTQPFLVTAIVRWPSGRGERQIQVQTYIAERGGEPDSELRAPAEFVDRQKRWHPDEDE